MSSHLTARARVRVELTREIKEAAQAELVAVGPAALSLRAVARRIGMVPSGIYRYYDGRDALLTALIIDAYQALAQQAEAADRAAGPAPGDRWLAVGRAVRGWAWEHPAEWGLIYGTPVPDYQAPADTIEVGTTVIRLLIAMLGDAHPDGRAPLPIPPRITDDLHRWLGVVGDGAMVGMSDELMAAGVFAFTYLLGAISVELFGQFGADATPAAEMFDAGLRMTGVMLALSGINSP
jgi:AcrR family transcriptional regulator